MGVTIMPRIGVDAPASQGAILDIRLTNLAEVRARLAEIKDDVKNFGKDFNKTVLKLATNLQRKSASYAPIKTGFLDKPRMNQTATIDTVYSGKRFTIQFMPDYAWRLEEQKWGPEIGNPYRPRTQKKYNRLGTPIGPMFASRALRDFEKELTNSPPLYTIMESYKGLFKVSVSTGRGFDELPGQMGEGI